MFAKKFMSNWPRLYSLAGHISTLKPWRFMYEDDITGVRDPITGTIGFVSVMGNLGEHYSVTVYLGERAFGKYLELSADHENAVPETVLEIPQLMVSFEDKDFLEKEDRAIMKEIGIKFSGKKSWPVFRSYRPGMVPWFLDETEQESMIHFLEQFLEMAVRPESGARDLQSGSDVQDVFLVRECKKSGKNIKWKDTFQKILIPALEELNIPIQSGLLEKARNTPVGKNIYEIDFFLTLAQVREKNKRAYFPYMLLVIDQQSEFIISYEMMDPTDGIDKMLIQIPGNLLKIFSKGTSRPRAVYTPSHRLVDILLPVMKNLGIQFQFKPRLKSIDMVKSGIMEYFTKGTI